MPQGNCGKWFNAEKGFGFIAPRTAPPTFRPLRRSRVGIPHLEENQRVEFEVGQSPLTAGHRRPRRLTDNTTEHPAAPGLRAQRGALHFRQVRQRRGVAELLPYCRTVSQLSFFSAGRCRPRSPTSPGTRGSRPAGCRRGRGTSVGGRRRRLAGRRPRRHDGRRRVAGEIARTDEETPLVRTAVDARLLPLAAQWTRGAVKTVPAAWLPGPRELRAWTLAAGAPEADRYLLGLDPHAPDTHSPLASALMRIGIAPTLIGTRGARPALRISGRRRLSRLVETVGNPRAG